MRDFLLSTAFAALTLAGCADISTGGADAGASASSPDAGEAGVVGAACGATGPNQLCRVTSVCPKVVVDAERFPNCGFRIRGSVVDIQCVCFGESLCPLGTPSTCAEATQLLANQSEAAACSQVMEGRCIALPVAPAKPSTCDKVCAADCRGDTTCRQSCGC